ncbi:MAG: methyltransferase domain-containing protein [Deltaproteobacteria bacterium]|nr:methyltransferase domain-containing protein [Deltaproteobacteria bacterium]
MGTKRDEAASYEHDVAVVFDRLSERYSAAYTDYACDLAGVHAGEQALDVGTGTGMMARALGSRLGGSGKVLGVDLSEGMLEYAAERGRKLGLTPHIVKFARGDAEKLEVADSSVDLVTSLFLLRHLPHPELAAREMLRVLRPGGRFVVGVGSAGPWVSARGTRYRARRLRVLVEERLGLSLLAPQFILKMVESHLCGEPRLHGTEGSSALSTRSGPRTEALLRKTGFTELRSSWRGHVDGIEDPEEFWELSLHFSSAARYRILGARPEAVERLRAAFLSTCNQVLDRGGSLVYPHGAWFVRGRRPR